MAKGRKPKAESRGQVLLQLTIDKLIYGGDGLARGPATERGKGKAVFVPFVLAGERIEARVLEEKPGFVRAEAHKVLQASPERTTPHCPYFGECGGCHYQHAGYESQLRIKTGILGETLQRIGGIEVPPIQEHPSAPWHYRNRTRVKVRGGDKFALGYFRGNSHTLLPVEHCPISSPLINRALAAVWQLGHAHMVADVLVEIEFFANAADNQLLLEFTLPDQYWTHSRQPSLAEFVTELRHLLPEVAGVVAFRTTAQGPLVREEVPQQLRETFGADELVYDTGGCEYHVSAGSFFQTNRYLTTTLLDLVTTGRTGDAALDLYAGTGLFALPLSQSFREVTAVEAAPFSFHDLRRNTPSNVEAHRETTEDFLARMDETTEFDLVVVDPPRAGLGEKTAADLSRLNTSQITYVSCDPATLARDLKVLLAAGFRVDQMHVVDLFPQTYHIESVTQLVR
jgi:23S rRNA (uracil1939-C5)-methyltransferase